jgi:putative flavoprotein involved in K+ transport
VDNIIWSTGFKADFSWIHIPSVCNAEGKVKHRRGVTTNKGLYFLGLPWQHRRGSSFIQGVGEDARYLLTLLHKGMDNFFKHCKCLKESKPRENCIDS